MKIGIDVSASNSKSTGTGRYINCLLEQLKLSDNEIRVFPSSNDNTEKIKNFYGKKILGISRHFYRMYGLTHELKKSKVDCGIFPNYFISKNFFKPSAIIIHDLSFITHPHFYSKKFVLYYKYLLKETLKKDPLILTVSEHTKENICRCLNIKNEKVFLLQAYPDIIKGSGSKEQIKTETPYLLYVGHIEPRKNLLFMINNFLAWKNESKSDIRLKLIGEIWIKSKEVNYLLKKYSNHPDIIFKGYVNEEELDCQYKNAFGFIHTSLEEGFGFPILEAMDYDLPVLCSDNHAAKEISSPFSITFDPYNNESFKRGLSELYENKINNIIPRYNIKYSQELMQSQLNTVLEALQSRSIKKIFYNSNKPKTYEEAIEKTLIYSHLFNGGLHKNDLYKFLFDMKISEEQFDNALSGLVYSNRINLKNDNVSLNYRNINIYKKAIKNINRKKIKRALQILINIPFISSICFSGGTANYGIENHNDIDLFIITKPNSLYLVYITIHILSKIFNLRKQLCANFLIDETGLEIKTQHDYYTAHQIISLTPFKDSEMLEQFRKYNNWIAEFFPNYVSQYYGVNKSQKNSAKLYLVLKPLNKLLKYFYLFLYRNHLKNNFYDAIKLDDKCIKLYTNDHRIKVLEAFNNEWKIYQETKKQEAATLKVTGTYSW